MRKALHETVRVADAGMRQGGGRDEREGGGERADQTTVHGGFLPLQGKNIETKLHIKHAEAVQGSGAGRSERTIAQGSRQDASGASDACPARGRLTRLQLINIFL